MQNQALTQLVLHNRAALDLAAQRSSLWRFAVLALLLPVILFAVLAYVVGFDKMEQFPHHLWKKITEDPLEPVLMLLALIASILHLAYLMGAKHKDRLILTDNGMSYESPLPRTLQWLNPNWSFPWSQVRRIYVEQRVKSLSPQFARLVFDIGPRKRHVLPYFWVDATTYRPPSAKELMQKRLKGKALISMADVLESPIVKFLQRLPYLKLDLPNAAAYTPFALEKSPAAIGVIAVFILLAAYALVDGFITFEDDYVDPAYYDVFIGGGAVVALFCAWLMRRHAVPITESVGVALLAGVAFGAALYPALLRINQLTDIEGRQTYHYRAVKIFHFEATVPDLPDLHFVEAYPEFWAQYRPGTVETFELRRGGLGFYQIHMRPIGERTRQFYEKQRDTKPTPTRGPSR